MTSGTESLTDPTADQTAESLTDPLADQLAAALDELLADQRRLVAMDAVHNFRDLGGYPTTSGATVRWRALFRSDGLHRVTDADLDIVRRLGLRTVVDLRSHTELSEHGTFPHDRCAVEFAHFPVIDATWDRADLERIGNDHDFLVWAYRAMLTEGAPRFAAAFEQLARPGALPAVFHCAAGKDRTGILAALVLGAVGVPQACIVADYALTAAGMARMRAWAERESAEAAARWAEVPSGFMAALPEAMAELLDGLVAEHGSIRGYVRSIGVPDATIDALAAALLMPAA